MYVQCPSGCGKLVKDISLVCCQPCWEVYWEFLQIQMAAMSEDDLPSIENLNFLHSDQCVIRQEARRASYQN